jgi:hypothetical protein
MATDRTRRGPGNADPGARHTIRDDGKPQGTAAKLESLVFVAAARDWLDYSLCGEIPIGEGIDAAQVLLIRAESFALAA